MRNEMRQQDKMLRRTVRDAETTDMDGDLTGLRTIAAGFSRLATRKA